MVTTVDPVIVAFIGGVVLGIGLSERRRASDDRDSVEQFLDERLTQIQDQYATTALDDEEWLAEEVLLLEDPGTERIMRDAVDVEGIGPARAYQIAEHFRGDWDAYREADPETLEAINGVGPNRAAALAS